MKEGRNKFKNLPGVGAGRKIKIK